MSKFWQILRVAGVLAGVVVLGILVGWLVTRNDQASVKPLPAPPGPEHVVAPPPSFPPQNANTNDLASAAVPSPSSNHLSTPVPPLAGTNVIADWEDRLETILGREDEDASAKAKRLLEIFPRLPEDGQASFAQHLANLTDDKDFAPTLAPYLTAPNTPGLVLDVLLADLLNRPNNVKLPILLDVARACPDQKAAGEAKEILTLFLDEDHGADWPAWDTKLKQWLADNPD